LQFSVSVEASLEAAHRLTTPPCDFVNAHGHTWRVRVTLMHETLGKDGNVPGSAGLKDALVELLSLYQYRDLNEKMPGVETTPGGIAVNIMERLSLRYPRINQVSVRMGEVEEVTVWRELRS